MATWPRMKKTYKVNEIFYSLQGEGYYTGRAATFVRLSGCNRRCAFCDTDHSAFTLLTAAEIAARAAAAPSSHVVLTGGEPAMQVDAELIDALHDAGAYIQIETNGTLPLPPGIDWVTCSPKDGPAPHALRCVDELKVVYQGQDVEAYLPHFVSSVLSLQPCDDGSRSNVQETADYILRHPHWRLSLQTHKLIGIR